MTTPLFRDLSRRRFLGLAATVPFLVRYHQLAAAEKKQVKIRDVQLMVLQGGRTYTLIKIVSDDGLYGIAEAYGTPGVGVKEQVLSLKPWLVGKDPLEIDTLYTQMGQGGSEGLGGTRITRTDGSAHSLMRAVSGIEMALWDLAGKVLGVPTTTLLGGRFRDEVRVYDHSGPRKALDKAACKEWARKVNEHPSGFTAHKFGFPRTDNDNARDPANRLLTTKALVNIRRGFENAREAVGWDHDIMAHCHWEYDLRTSIQIADAVESSRPLWLEDPLPVDYSDSWRRLCASSRVPILTGENLTRREGFKDFIIIQGCDIVNPDLRNTGGFLETKRIADMAHIFGLPMCNHNTGSQVYTSPPSSLGPPFATTWRSKPSPARVAGWIRCCCSTGPISKNGFVQVSDKPGLGIELNPDVVKAHLVEGERWWG
jgi:L-alanine-DL-glutamate epimerase-like enolase superfamily enzyme